MTRPGRECLDAFRRADHDNMRRGVRYRIVVPDSARTGHAAARLCALALAGAEIRTVPEIPADALVIDGAIVALPVGNTEGETGGAAVFRLPSVVATTAELFERVWCTVVPIAPAAARLGISVRTVRRMVAGLMHRLGARSRFQAGAKAADRGWLVEHAC